MGVAALSLRHHLRANGPAVTERVDVAIVGGGPAGAALAIRLAERGIETALFERVSEPSWRACGVFSSPLTRHRLTDLGFDRAQIDSLHRPISALNLQTTSGSSCRIEYGDGLACGFDRVRLDASLLDLARERGANVRLSSVVRHVKLPDDAAAGATLTVSTTAHGGGVDSAAPTGRSVLARLIVGADGAASTVARAAGVHRTSRFLARMGLTFHLRDPGAAPERAPMEGRFVFGPNWYTGVAPVPEQRVNVGMVIPVELHSKESTAAVARRLIAALPPPRDAWADEPVTDHVAVAGRLEHHVSRASGPGFLLVGDAIQFIDPLTGEGLLRALVSADFAADAIVGTLRGDRSALPVYDRRIRNRWRSKNVVSWILQLFLAQPRAFDYALRRLATREALRERLTMVLTDQARATHALDPRFLARLLAP